VTNFPPDLAAQVSDSVFRAEKSGTPKGNAPALTAIQPKLEGS
jgi:hypothetical protein